MCRLGKQVPGCCGRSQRLLSQMLIPELDPRWVQGLALVLVLVLALFCVGIDGLTGGLHRQSLEGPPSEKPPIAVGVESRQVRVFVEGSVLPVNGSVSQPRTRGTEQVRSR